MKKLDSVIVEEVRERRRRISSRYENDLRKYVDHLKEVEREHSQRVVRPPNRRARSRHSED